MELHNVRLTIRGHDIELDVPGHGAPEHLALARDFQMLLLALVALDNPAVDAVLTAFGFHLQVGEVTIFPCASPDGGA